MANRDVRSAKAPETPVSQTLLRLVMANRRSEAASTPTRDMIVRISIRFFAEYGYGGTSMRNIADACNIKAASIYQYFESKEALLLSCLFDVLGQFQSYIIEDIDADLAPEGLLERVVRRHTSFQLRYADLAGAWDIVADSQRVSHVLGDDAREIIATRRGLYYDLLVSLVAACTSGGARLKALAMLSLCDRAGLWGSTAAADLTATENRAWALAQAVLSADVA